jgi:MFS family permease
VLGLSLFIGQAFLSNAVFFTQALTCCRGAADRDRLLFNAGALSATTLTACWVVVFFFASAGASAAYLTGSEIFPMETRAMALAFFYAVGTGIGGVTGPALFGKLVETEKEVNVMYGYLLGAVLMIAAGVAEWFIGVEAAGKSLEDVAKPLTADEDEAEAPA